MIIAPVNRYKVKDQRDEMPSYEKAIIVLTDVSDVCALTESKVRRKGLESSSQILKYLLTGVVKPRNQKPKK